MFIHIFYIEIYFYILFDIPGHLGKWRSTQLILNFLQKIKDPLLLPLLLLTP